MPDVSRDDGFDPDRWTPASLSRGTAAAARAGHLPPHDRLAEQWLARPGRPPRPADDRLSFSRRRWSACSSRAASRSRSRTSRDRAPIPKRPEEVPAGRKGGADAAALRRAELPTSSSSTLGRLDRVAEGPRRGVGAPISSPMPTRKLPRVRTPSARGRARTSSSRAGSTSRTAGSPATAPSTSPRSGWCLCPPSSTRRCAPSGVRSSSTSWSRSSGCRWPPTR